MNMKKIIILFVILSLVAMCGCKATVDVTNPTTKPVTPSGNTETPTTVAPTNPSFDDIDWESEIDVDESFLAENDPTDPQETEPTEPGNSEPTSGATEPGASEPTASEPGNSEPVATEPEVTAPPKPVTNPDGAIELPMIPG